MAKSSLSMSGVNANSGALLGSKRSGLGKDRCTKYIRGIANEKFLLIQTQSSFFIPREELHNKYEIKTL
uniref:Uncharacterized protein n=1 Tax=Romanomermis culicivorax TaxID=13658 RepID=A0A915L3B7_ROMCU